MAFALKNSFPYVEKTLDLADLLEKYKHTPDILDLAMGRHWYVFEYGECMEGHREHDDFLDQKAELVGTAFTKYSNLILYKKDLGIHSYPVALQHVPKAPSWTRNMVKTPWQRKRGPGRIKGELYEVTGHDAIVELDNMRLNTVSFRRVRLTVLLPYTKSTWDKELGQWKSEEHLAETPAWIYVGVKDYWDGILDAGYSSHLVSRFQHINNRSPYPHYSMGDYYYYSQLEVLDDEERNGGKIPL